MVGVRKWTSKTKPDPCRRRIRFQTRIFSEKFNLIPKNIAGLWIRFAPDSESCLSLSYSKNFRNIGWIKSLNFLNPIHSQYIHLRVRNWNWENAWVTCMLYRITSTYRAKMHSETASLHLIEKWRHFVCPKT